MSDQTEQAMLAAIRDHIADETGKDTYGAIVVLVDTTPLEDIEDSTSGAFYHYKHGGFYACEGLLSLAQTTTTLETTLEDEDDHDNI